MLRADATLFSIDANTGLLTFLTAPDFESPADSGGDNVYEVTVRVTDSGGLSDHVTYNINVDDVTETTLAPEPEPEPAPEPEPEPEPEPTGENGPAPGPTPEDSGETDDPQATDDSGDDAGDDAGEETTEEATEETSEDSTDDSSDASDATVADEPQASAGTDPLATTDNGSADGSAMTSTQPTADEVLKLRHELESETDRVILALREQLIADTGGLSSSILDEIINRDDISLNFDKIDIRIPDTQETVNKIINHVSKVSQEIDVLLEDLGQELDDSAAFGSTNVGFSAGVVSASLSMTAGYLVWLVRLGYLLTGTMTILPSVWNINPIPVLDASGSKRAGAAGDGDDAENKRERDKKSFADQKELDMMFKD